MAKVGGEEINLTPTESMANEAQKGLDWRKDGADGGTAVGVARARQLVNRQELSPSTVRRMHSFFSRHEVDKKGEGFSPGEPGYPSNGRVAWALWGGDPGQTWARAKSKTLDRLEGKSVDYTKEFMDEEVDTDFGASCPVVTHDADVNMANHLVAIKEANLGPADPTAQSDSYWSYMAEKWMVSADEARVRQCQNCEYYNNSPKILDCLKSSTLQASDLPVTPKWVDVSAPSGYCTKWDITCTSIRTCLEWEPTEQESDDEETDDTGETGVTNEPLGGGPNMDDQMMILSADKKQTKMFTFDTSLKAVDTGQDGELKIEGYASTTAIDRSADVILASAWTKSGGLSNFQRNPILLFNHNYDKPIGKVVAMGTDSKGLKINGVISKSAGDVYNLVKEGVLSTFSVGFMIKDAEYDKQNDGLIVKDAELLEISVVSVPCNQDATFSVAKSFDSQTDYLTFRKQFETALGGQPSAETGGSSEGAEMASRKIKMDETTNEQIQKAVADALAAKSLADAAAAQKAADEQAATDKMVAKVLESAEEKIYSELEKRFKDDNTDLNTKLEGLRTELAEKSVELQNIANSKRVFTDRGNNGEWKKEFAKEMDDAFLLGRITGKGYNTDFARDVLEKVNTMSSVQVSTDNFEREVSINIEREIQLELILAPLFREIAMTSASMVLPIMPDTNYAQITSAAALPGSPPAGTLDARGVAIGTDAGIAMTEIELRTIKMIAKSYLGNETEEDAILPILPLLREGMIRQHARGVENLILLGGHADGAYPSVSATAASGLLKYASTNSRSVTAAGTATPLTAAALLGLRKQMGKYGLRPTDVAYIVSQQCYFELLEDAEFQDFNLVNTQATKLTGEVGQIFGSSVMVCDEFPAAATGKFHALAVNTRNFVVPRQRGITVESQYLVENQHKVLATTQRLGFKEIIPNAKSVIGLKYA